MTSERRMVALVLGFALVASLTLTIWQGALDLNLVHLRAARDPKERTTLRFIELPVLAVHAAPSEPSDSAKQEDPERNAHER